MILYSWKTEPVSQFKYKKIIRYMKVIKISREKKNYRISFFRINLVKHYVETKFSKIELLI